jgi:ribonucleoside-triphosphate reductase
MHDCGIGYGSINHPVDRDPICGYVGVIGDVCPRCGRHEGEALSEERMEELVKKYPQIKSFVGIE